MKAIRYELFGEPEVLHLVEMEKPRPKTDEILVRVHAISVNFGDLIARKFRYVKRKDFSMPGLFYVMARLAFGFRKPRVNVLGSEFSGVVESIGAEVKMFRPGDKVFGYRGQSMGAYAEYLTMNEKNCIALMPDNLGFEEAAVSTYGALMALPLLCKANITVGQKVLINGASGSIGSAALQIAKSMGAEVSGVCGTRKVDMVKKLGADRVFDYSTEDFTQSGILFDLIFDIQGKLSYQGCKNSLTANGKLMYVSFKTGKLLQSIFNKKTICALAPANVALMRDLQELFETGKLKAIVDKTFPMEQAAAAHRFVEDNKAKGPVAIFINPKMKDQRKNNRKDEYESSNF